MLQYVMEGGGRKKVNNLKSADQELIATFGSIFAILIFNETSFLNNSADRDIVKISCYHVITPVSIHYLQCIHCLLHYMRRNI